MDDDYKLCPLEEESQRVDKIAEFLRPFYDMTILFSGSKYPIANLYFPNVWKIQCLLNKEANSPDFLISEIASNMKTKFQKYWDCYSVILSFAIILDPRYKLKFVEYCFFVLDPQSRDEKILSIKQKLFRLFEEYSKTNTGITAAPMESTFNGDDGQTRDLMDGFDVTNLNKGCSRICPFVISLGLNAAQVPQSKLVSALNSSIFEVLSSCLSFLSELLKD
ncbi:zinc finger BED domain-containing protein DAYSLEEPER-like [Coffea arabica]|uniref:Zinc finger BED domain-containing protein DAYSLEEPER-like n=1 Tax=Coffea arabica TaxID=13443 RepID=A0ABM4VC43_COFAR